MNLHRPVRRIPPGTSSPDLPSAVPVPFLTVRALVVTSLLALGGCASPGSDDRVAPADPALGGALPSAPASRAAPTLYDEIGGEAGVAALAERFIREIATDDRVRGHYRDSDMGRFYRMMQAHMCEATGGGCTYEGDDMRRTHGGMNITPTEFNGIVEALMRAMDAENLPVGVQNRILAIYAPMREDIIDR